MSRRIRLVVALVFAVVAVALSAEVADRAHAATTAPRVAAPCAVVMDAESGRVLFSKAAHQKRQMASCTKVMTALLAIYRLPPERVLVVPDAVRRLSGTLLGLRPGQRISMEDALQGYIVLSANDAGLTLACAVSGSQGKFVKLMNQAAALWGLRDTHYDNCNGNAADPDHHTSAYDLARLARRAMQEPRFRDVAAMRSVLVRWSGGHSRYVASRNPLLQYSWADGVKPGVTQSAGRCLVGSGKPGLRALITVTLHGRSRSDTLQDALALFDYGSSLFEQRDLVQPGEVVGHLTAADGTVVTVAATDAVSAVVRKAATVRRTLVAEPLATAPAAGTVVGELGLRADGLSLGATDMVVVAPTP